MAELRINPNASAIWLEWGGDLVVSQNGGLIMASGWDQVRQRILRRLLTTAQITRHDGESFDAEYIFDTEYGLSFRTREGDLFSDSYADELKALINSAVIVDEGTDPARPPKIDMRRTNHLVDIAITVYLSDGTLGRIPFQISR